ncbi:DUF5719 family protein [Microbacterium sp. NPDC087591]|jgi:hypothetical protein|uniref:DUF5719 family protein n=1 Tax=Microbacterium sp. NPDC087591 TaxID=3364192 RepID=UPI0038141448
MSMNRGVRVAATGARLVAGAAVAVACVVGVVTAIHAPWPEVRHDPAQVQVTPLPGDSVLVCNGDLRALGRDTANPLAMWSAASPTVTVDGTSGAPEIGTLQVPDLVGAGEVRTVTGAVEERTAPLVAATESATVEADDLRGFAALPCGTPRLESWLVGGTVDTGTSDLIILTNAAQVPSTVTLSVYGTSRGTRTVIVPAGTQVALPLTSIAAGNALPVVEVTADGAPVRAVLQSSLVRTLDPAGVDLQEAVAGPQLHPVLAGVRSFAADGDDADMTVLRLLSPEDAAQARVTVRASGASSIANEFTVSLTAGEPAEVSLSGLEPGMYSVQIDADAPIVSAIRQQDALVRGSDFSWMTPAPEIDSDALVAVPAGPSPRLQLVNDTDADATITLEPTNGKPATEVTVPANGSVDTAVTQRTSYLLRTTGTVHAAITMSADGALAGWPVQPSAGAAESITVYP